jgi:restriction system protein
MSSSKWQRDQERQRKAFEKAEQQRQRAEEKASKEEHLAQQERKTHSLNTELEKRLEDLQNILEKAVRKAFDFDRLTSLAIDSIVIPQVPQAPPQPNRELYEGMMPDTRLLERLTGIGRSKRQGRIKEIEENYRHVFEVYQKEKAKYDAAVLAKQQATAAQNQAIANLRERVRTKDPKALMRYFTAVLEKSEYPSNFPKPKVKLSYNPETGELVLEYDLPKHGVIMPSIKGYKYVKTGDKVQEVSLTQTDERRMKALYEDVIAAITLRSLHELFKSDQMQTLNLIIFNGMVNTIDKATGKDIRPCLVSVQVTRDQFAALDLERVDKTTCLKHLKAQTSPSYQELVPVKPLVELITTDARFIEQADVLSKLDSRPNLIEMSPADFEQLISNLFTQIGFKTGTTRLSRDGGVDVIAFDERPILGGKIVIQAKRYRNTVDVESVRALYGVMQDEGATKGILVTTSSFGTASREFVKGKPIELLDGNGLLYLLEQHGHQAKIELSK